MQDLTHFLAQHWLLVIAFVVVLLFYVTEEMKSQGKGGGTVNPEGAVRLMNREDAAVLDLRSPSIFKKGHIINAINIAKADIDSNMHKLKKFQSKKLVVVCQQGNDSGRVALSLRREGFSHPMVLAGGMDAWTAAKLPVITS